MKIGIQTWGTEGDILMTHFFDPVIEDMAAVAKTLCAENDIVIAHFFLYPMKIAALKKRRPLVTVFTTPLIPSRHIPPLGVPDLATWMNPVWWKFFDIALNITWKPTIDQRYRREGVEPESSVIHGITKAPHQHIFPHCAAVVHHGGAGTTQAATIAGCPSIVVEHASDQPLWGSVLQRMGIAPKMLHRRSLTAQKLARAIRSVLQTPSMKKKAEEIGAMMQKEDGLARAVALGEQYGKIDK